MPFMIPVFGAIASALGTAGAAIATPFEALGITAANTLGPALGAIGGGSALGGLSTLGGLATTGAGLAEKVSQPSQQDLVNSLTQGLASSQPTAPQPTAPTPVTPPTSAPAAPAAPTITDAQRQQFLAQAGGAFANTQAQTGGSLSPNYYDQLAQQISQNTFGSNQPDLVNQAVNGFFGFNQGQQPQGG
jgi:hypothetical protein